MTTANPGCALTKCIRETSRNPRTGALRGAGGGRGSLGSVRRPGGAPGRRGRHPLREVRLLRRRHHHRRHGDHRMVQVRLDGAVIAYGVEVF